jgi:hypothetical protein
MFLLTFPLARVIRTGRLRLSAVIATAAITFFFLLFGKQVFEALITQAALTERLAYIGNDAQKGVRMVMREFAFPVVVVANASLEVPDKVDYRWLYDFPLAIQYLIPQRLLGVTHPPTVSMLNSALFYAQGTIPVDLVSLGFYTASVPGVVLVLTGFGALLALFERWLPAGPDPVDCVRRSAWILFLCVRVMYGDPQLIWPGGLHLIVMEGLLLIARILAERRSLASLPTSA